MADWSIKINRGRGYNPFKSGWNLSLVIDAAPQASVSYRDRQSFRDKSDTFVKRCNPVRRCWEKKSRDIRFSQHWTEWPQEATQRRCVPSSNLHSFVRHRFQNHTAFALSVPLANPFSFSVWDNARASRNWVVPLHKINNLHFKYWKFLWKISHDFPGQVCV